MLEVPQPVATVARTLCKQLLDTKLLPPHHHHLPLSIPHRCGQTRTKPLLRLLEDRVCRQERPHTSASWQQMRCRKVATSEDALASKALDSNG